jgi:ABC-2 type transport system permease protein
VIGVPKIIAAAVREYRVTALTWAFLLGAVVFPAVIWIVMIAVTATGVLATEREPISGTVAVYDRTDGESAVAALREAFDPAAQKQRQLQQIDRLREAVERQPALQAMGVDDAQLDQIEAQLRRQIENASPARVDIESLPDGADLDAAQAAVRAGDRLALIVVDERSLALPIDRIAREAQDDAGAEPGVDPPADGPAMLDPGGVGAPTDGALAGDGDGDTDADADVPGERTLGEYQLYHSVNLDTTYLEQIEDAVHRAIQDERYRRLDIEPSKVLLVAQNAPRAAKTVITEAGDEAKSAAALTEFLPFIFLFLMYAAVLTGGNYLLMGTLEEKQSRVMEVLLSAVSPWQLLVGKMAGQAAVGLTVLLIYGGVGVLVANEFGYLSAIPLASLPLFVVFFVMAYLFLGAMMAAVGASVTEFREAQALYPPITISLILPFILMIAIMENPASWIARVFTFFPPTTPFVMVMRLSQPAYPVPWWETALAIIVGFVGVAIMIALAARIFRVGVLSYGKAPSLLGVLKWARQGV